MTITNNPNAQTEAEKRRLLDNIGVCGSTAKAAMTPLQADMDHLEPMSAPETKEGTMAERPKMGTVVDINTKKTLRATSSY